MAKAGAGKNEDKDSITVEFLDAFNAQKANIEKSIEAVAFATKQLNSMSEQMKNAFDPEDIARISKQMADIVKKAQADASKGKKLLDDFQKEGETLVRSNPKSARLQPYKAQYMRLCKQFVDTMKEHQRSKESMRKAQVDDLVRRGGIIYGDQKSESEIREKVERDPANFVREAIMEEAAEEAQQAYVDAQSRARDVEMLVKSLNEVAAMFQDLAVLVQQQSEMLDQIEDNVETAGRYMRKGNEQLRSAIEYQKKSRKCKCCLLFALIIIVIAIVAGVGSVFGIKSM